MKMAESGKVVLVSCIIDFDDIQVWLRQFSLNLKSHCDESSFIEFRWCCKNKTIYLGTFKWTFFLANQNFRKSNAKSLSAINLNSIRWDPNVCKILHQHCPQSLLSPHLSLPSPHQSLTTNPLRASSLFPNVCSGNFSDTFPTFPSYLHVPLPLPPLPGPALPPRPKAG